jgi:hypothetical protein
LLSRALPEYKLFHSNLSKAEGETRPQPAWAVQIQWSLRILTHGNSVFSAFTPSISDPKDVASSSSSTLPEKQLRLKFYSVWAVTSTDVVGSPYSEGETVPVRFLSYSVADNSRTQEKQHSGEATLRSKQPSKKQFCERRPCKVREGVLDSGGDFGLYSAFSFQILIPSFES